MKRAFPVLAGAAVLGWWWLKAPPSSPANGATKPTPPSSPARAPTVPNLWVIAQAGTVAEGVAIVQGAIAEWGLMAKVVSTSLTEDPTMVRIGVAAVDPQTAADALYPNMAGILAVEV